MDHLDESRGARLQAALEAALMDLRSANGTRHKHQELALGCRESLREALPNIYKAAFD